MDLPLAIVIEDDRDLAMVYSQAVKSAGFSVEAISTGTEGLARLKEVIPMLVVLDLHLPGISGLEIFEYLRSDPRLAGVQVIITSADERLAELADGATLVLLKPVSLAQLRDFAKRLRS